MIEQSPSIVNLAAALVAAQGEFRNPPKDSTNPHFKSKFADLATVRETVQPTLLKYGLAVSQLPCEVEGVGPGLCTMLIHASGEFVRATIALRPGKTDPQGIGAALTYARRYGLQAILGVVADDDDDGNAASRPPQQRQQEQRPAQQQPKPQPQQSGQQSAPKAKKEAATVAELFASMDAVKRSPKDGTELVAWLKSAEQQLRRLVPDYHPAELFDAVAGFLRVDGLYGIAVVDLARDLGDGWNRAKEFVKACAEPAKAGAK